MTHNIKYSIIAAAAAIVGLSGCEKESFFAVNDGEGQLDCRALNVDYINSGRQTRADNIDIADFDVYFIKTETGDTIRKYKYGEMPEMVTLPKGDYRVDAVYGDNPIAKWDSPYYLGSSTFSITPGKITEDIEPVECELSNIRIRVNIDDLGLGIVGDDAKVVVKVGDDGELEYTKEDKAKSGYFRYVANSQSITATFSGTVDGVYVEGITRAYDDASGGNSYLINFAISKPDAVEPGGIQIGDDSNDGIFVDATIAVKDENIVIDPEESNNQDQEFVDMRPVEGDQPNTPGNDNPNQGGTTEPDNTENPGGDNPSQEDPAPAAKGPQIIMTTDDLVLNKCGNAYAPDEEAGLEGTKVSFKVVSETGITDFLINIDSTTLTPDELEGVGLGADIDLINPGDFEDSLVGLGFAVGNSVKNQLEVEFDISGFVGLLNALGEGEHKFNLTVTDSTGTTKGIVWFRNIKNK